MQNQTMHLQVTATHYPHCKLHLTQPAYLLSLRLDELIEAGVFTDALTDFQSIVVCWPAVHCDPLKTLRAHRLTMWFSCPGCAMFVQRLPILGNVQGNQYGRSAHSYKEELIALRIAIN